MSDIHTHLDDVRFQALLDGELPAAEAARLRAEIDGCARCSSEFEAWQLLFEDLGDLPILVPSVDFSDRILGSLPEPKRASARLTGLLHRPAAATAPGHLAADEMQDFLDGQLAARSMTRMERHLDGCAICRDELAAHRRVMTALGDLPVLAPSSEFAERVMAGVRIRQMAQLAMAPVTPQERVLAWLRQMVPDTRQGWAAAMGMLVTPVTLMVLLVRAVFANEMVTVSNLGAFAWLKLSDSLGGAFESAGAFLMDQSIVRVTVSLLEMTGGGSTVIAASGAALLATTMVAMWIVYRNVISSSADEGSYAHLSF